MTPASPTVRAWLDAREPAPAALAARLADVMAREGLLHAPHRSERYLEAAESLLARMLGQGCAARESALDLLVCDALMTYAFEAAAANPAGLTPLTERAMARIGVLAAEHGAGGTAVASGGTA